MSSVKQWLALVLMAMILAACAPAETGDDSRTVGPDATEEMEERTATPNETAVPVEPAMTDSPAPTPTLTRPTVEIAPETTTKPAPPEEIYPMPDDATAVPPDDPRALALIDKATTDLAQRTGVPEEEIVLAEFRYVTWPNTSLGCPEPGMAYADMLVDGYLIMLRAGLGVYSYHGAVDSSPFLCERTTKIVPPPARSLDS
ncbi:MAG: hypothetical protein PVH65_09390 [Chloroflexota bacterium]|jgi:hypothetical protein